MEPAQTPAEIRETLEGTQKGGVKNSIRNCLTVFQRDPLFRGALRLNLLTEQIDIVKPQPGAHQYHADRHGHELPAFVSGRKFRAYQARKRCRAPSRLLPMKTATIRQGLPEQPAMGRQERIRYALHHFLGADTDEYTYEALKLFLMGTIRRVFRPGSKFEVMLCLVGGREPGNLPFFSGCWQAGTNGFQTI